MCEQKKFSFTMVELMVVVVILGVIASVAVPMYAKKHTQNARVAEATTRIGEIVTEAKCFAMENRVNGNPTWPSGSGGLVDLRASPNFSYAITAGGGANANVTVFKVVATGRTDSSVEGVTITVTVPNIRESAGLPVINGI